MALENQQHELTIASTALPTSHTTTELLSSHSPSQPSRMMGQNGSSVAGDGARDDDSRSTSPLSNADEGYDGLPRPSAAAAAASDFNMNFSQQVDGLPRVFSPPGRPAQPAPAEPASQPSKKSRKSRKSNSSRRSSDAQRDDGAESDNNGPASDDLEAIARHLKAEAVSPVATKTKKKKHRKSKDKTQTSEESQDHSILQQESPAPEEDLPAIPEVSAGPEEILDPPATQHSEEATTESPNSQRKKKKMSRADKGKGTRLDLNEDPIAGSDDDVVVPSSDRPSRRRRSHHDENGSSRKFKRTSIPTVTEMDVSNIEDVASQEAAANVVESTQGNASAAGPASAPVDFLQRSREAEHYDIGEDYSSPLVTRKERRARFATTMSASASLAEALSTERTSVDPYEVPVTSYITNGGAGAVAPVADMGGMDLDVIDPQLEASVGNAVSDNRMGPPSDYSGDLPTHQDEDVVMGDEVQLPQLNQPTQQPTVGDLDLMSSLEDDALMAMASTQPQPATDDDRSGSGRSSAVLPATNGHDSEARSGSTRSSQADNQPRRQRDAQAKAAAKESRMALQFMLDRQNAANAADAAPGSEVDAGTEAGQGGVSLQPGTSDLLGEGSSQSDRAQSSAPRASSSRVNGSEFAPNNDRSPTAHFPATQTSGHPTPRSTRTYSRQPKPSFFERGEQETAQAFAELPPNEAAATPQPRKARTKRRLPVELPEAEVAASPSKRQKSAPKVRKDPEAPRKAPGRKKAPETAIRSSTGYLTGVLTKTEVKQVEKAVEDFRSDHDLTQMEVNTIIHQNPKDPNLKDNTLNEELWARIMDACPTRPRQKLLNWCRQKFHNFVARATWTPEQDAELREMIENYGHKWNVIGQMINRHQKDVRDRYRNYLIAGNNRRENAWDAQEEREFLDIVGEVLAIFQEERRRNPDSDMFKSGKTNEELVDWNVVAERMKQGRTRIQCQEKWRRMREGNKINDTVLAALVEPDQRWRLKRARHEIASMSHADMYHIVLAIPALDAGAKEDIRINWKAILESQRKKYHRYTAMLLWSRLRQLVPDQEKKNVQRCAKELITMYQSDGGTFAIPGDDAFDEAEEEKLLADIPPPRKRGPGKPKPGKGKGKASQGRRGSTRAVSDEFVHDSDSDEDAEADDDEVESSRAENDETSPAQEDASAEPSQLPEEEEEEEEEHDEDADADLSDHEVGHGDRGGSIDLGVDPGIYDDMPTSPQPPKSATSKSKKKEKAVEQPAPPASAVKKHKKRYSGEMTTDFAPQKAAAAAAPTAPSAAAAAGGSANTSRKRARADATTDGSTPNGSADAGDGARRRNKRAKRVSAPIDAGPASSDDEMEDIPAVLPDAVV